MFDLYPILFYISFVSFLHFISKNVLYSNLHHCICKIKNGTALSRPHHLSMIAVSIDYINGKPTTSKVECICGTRNMRIRNVALVNDIVALKIVAHLNGTIHAVMNEPELGIIFTKCRKCVGKVVAKSSDAIKCTECGWIDERKLSSNFGKSNFVKLRE